MKLNLEHLPQSENWCLESVLMRHWNLISIDVDPHRSNERMIQLWLKGDEDKSHFLFVAITCAIQHMMEIWLSGDEYENKFSVYFLTYKPLRIYHGFHIIIIQTVQNEC